MSQELLFTACILCLLNPVELFKGSKGMLKEWVELNVPKLQPNYNPNHGYEPYWPGGHWLYMETPLGQNETTTETPKICGDECNYLYRRIGAVCGRLVDNRDYQKCFKLFGLICIHSWHDVFSAGFRTFDTYCKFLDAQCRSHIKKRWFFVHEGACIHDTQKYFYPLLTPGPLERLSSHFKALGTNFEKVGLDSPLRQGLQVPGPMGEDTSILFDGGFAQMLDAADQLNSGAIQRINHGNLRYTLPYTIKQYIHNFVKEIFLKSDEYNK